MTEDAVTFTDATKTYGPIRAVDGVSLTIPRGQVVALLGPNGAGKSTTINMLLGLTPPDEGTVEVFGGPPDRAVRAGLIGAMPQEARLIPRVRVRELIGFIRRTYPAPEPVTEILATARIADLADRWVDRLSGGQAQRVRFAMALAGGPDLIVLDEPTAALDVESRRELWASMHAYAERGKTVLFSTHYLEEADDNADRVVVIDHGRVVADGTSAEIKRRVGGRVVSFGLGEVPVAGLDRLPGVVAVEIGGGRARLRSNDSDATVRALARDHLIRDLEVTGAGLEAAFLALTAEGAS
ncbi:ATP-binding cassette domain-containing protein [Actinomadura sp. HBU206391]|uniref:ABC transporter ATP-binding protein n=1 Tax=Actinomadura sp. HBU206391 TaxID=2731692 RepID=UPI00164F18A1|nr:ABC transporter ATP-binding protein [Actinomadura sp. HBU206391]MBC6462305.1 ABC transporter ATP-binding protein [Actinomadura sp. HBU206391]